MGFNDPPKNPRLSIHNKYKRRLRRLSLTFDDFLSHAVMKLDPTATVYKREEIEKLVAKCRELAALLPDPATAIDCRPIREDFLEILEASAGETEKILAEADASFKDLSKEEWDEMMKEYHKRD